MKLPFNEAAPLWFSLHAALTVLLGRGSSLQGPQPLPQGPYLPLGTDELKSSGPSRQLSLCPRGEGPGQGGPRKEAAEACAHLVWMSSKVGGEGKLGCDLGPTAPSGRSAAPALGVTPVEPLQGSPCDSHRHLSKAVSEGRLQRPCSEDTLVLMGHGSSWCHPGGRASSSEAAAPPQPQPGSGSVQGMGQSTGSRGREVAPHTLEKSGCGGGG